MSLGACVLICTLFLVVCESRLAYNGDDGSILSGVEIGSYCHQHTRICTTNFEKNVFVSTSPIMDRDWTYKLFPFMADQFDDSQECGTGSKTMDMDTCSQIHCPMTLDHPSGELDPAYVVSQYGAKWEYVMNHKNTIYDSFLDYNVAYWVNDLSYFYDLWTSVNADIVLLRWTVSGDSSQTYYYSMISHNGKMSDTTLAQFELISDTFSNSDNMVFLESEQRAYMNNDIINYGVSSSGCTVYPIGARRSVSNVDENVDFYKEIFSSIITDSDNQIQRGTFIDYNGNTVKFAHILLEANSYSSSVSFFERDLTDSTYLGSNNNNQKGIISPHAAHGGLTVNKYESLMNAAHNNIVLSPFCGFDRWFDMHYAVNINNNDYYSGLYTLEAIMESGKTYTVFYDGDVVFLYIIEPNGHSVQFVFSLNSEIAEFTIDPNEWADDWCMIACTDSQKSVEFGARVFEWKTSNNNNNNNNNNLNNGGDYLSLENNSNVSFAVLTMFANKKTFVFIAFLVTMLIVAWYLGLWQRKNGKNGKNERITVNENTSLILKTMRDNNDKIDV